MMYGKPLPEILAQPLNLPKPNLKLATALKRKIKKDLQEIEAFHLFMKRERTRGWAKIKHLMITV